MESFKQFVENINNIRDITPSYIVQKKSKFFVDKDDTGTLKRNELVRFKYKGHNVKAQVTNFRNGKYELEPIK